MIEQQAQQAALKLILCPAPFFAFSSTTPSEAELCQR
jgi:hypothetical protein